MTEKPCPVHGTDCRARTRRQIEADATLVRMILEDGLRASHVHPSGCFEALKRLEAAALNTLDLRNQLDEWSDRFDLLTIDHEVTKGYRQHAEQQLAEIHRALDAWNGTDPLSADDLRRIDEARGRVMAKIAESDKEPNS